MASPIDKPPAKSPARTILEHAGVPSFFFQRPKLPSRNWLIFLTVTSTVASYYAYDRRECKRIKEEYIDKVKYLAEQPIRDSLDVPRRVKVYAAKWPGDEDFDISMRYFRKYLKPYLAAAAVDYEMIRGKRHGDIATQVSEEIRLRRRRDSGIDQASPHDLALPTYVPPDVMNQRELEGGIVIVGRPTWKEFMAGLKAGWTLGLEKVDRENILAQELENDGHFNELDGEGTPSQPPVVHPLSSALGSGVFSSIQQQQNQQENPFPSSLPSQNQNDISIPPPSSIPHLPALLLVDFTNFVGFKQIPLMIWGFFNQRDKVRSGAEAAYALIKGHTRPFHSPCTGAEPLFSELSRPFEPEATTPPPIQPNVLSKVQGGDLDFGRSSENYYRTWLSSTVSEIEKARANFYESLQDKLRTARALDRRTREPTKDETNYPPPTEFDLREERMKKELRWRSDLRGIDIIRPEREVVWDSRLKDSMRVFIQRSEEDADRKGDTS